MKYENVLEKVYEPRRLLTAWRQVKDNAGAAGVDGMSVKDFDERKKELFSILRNKLIEGKYRFKPARRMEIPKEGSSKKRKLGIPVVMDRIVSGSVNMVFESRSGCEREVLIVLCREWFKRLGLIFLDNFTIKSLG